MLMIRYRLNKFWVLLSSERERERERGGGEKERDEIHDAERLNLLVNFVQIKLLNHALQANYHEKVAISTSAPATNWKSKRL